MGRWCLLPPSLPCPLPPLFLRSPLGSRALPCTGPCQLHGARMSVCLLSSGAGPLLLPSLSLQNPRLAGQPPGPPGMYGTGPGGGIGHEGARGSGQVLSRAQIPLARSHPRDSERVSSPWGQDPLLLIYLSPLLQPDPAATFRGKAAIASFVLESSRRSICSGAVWGFELLCRGKLTGGSIPHCHLPWTPSSTSPPGSKPAGHLGLQVMPEHLAPNCGMLCLHPIPGQPLWAQPEGTAIV